MIRNRSIRAAAVVGSVALAAAALVSAASPANATFRIPPRTYTAVMTPTTAVPGQPTGYSVVVTNTSGKVSALDNFELVVPAGFTVTPGGVTAPRGGWTETVTGGQVIAHTSQPLRHALRRGESMTVSFTATDTTACDATAATWVQKADGIVIDPWVAQSPDPTVQMTPLADRFVLTSDGTDGPLLHKWVKEQSYQVTGQFLCGTVPAPAGAGTLALAATGTGTLAPSTVTVSPTDSSETFGASYSTVASTVTVTATWNGFGGASTSSFDVEVLGAANSTSGTPGTAITNFGVTGSNTGASANLGNGASGPVTIVVNACTDTSAPCDEGTQFELTGNFKNDDGSPLYGFGTTSSPLPPAEIDWTCLAVSCPHLDAAREGRHDSPNTSEERWEEFNDYPVYVSIRKDGVDTDFAQAPACVSPMDSRTTHQIKTSDAQSAGFCVDVNAISRGSSFTGDLTLPVLFVEDFKLRP